MGGTSRKSSREFKLEAVRMVTEGGYRANQVARDLDLLPDMMRRWRRQFERVTAERDILRKALGFVSDRRR